MSFQLKDSIDRVHSVEVFGDTIVLSNNSRGIRRSVSKHVCL